MTVREYDCAITIFQRLHAVYGMNNSTICSTFFAEVRQQVRHHHATRIYVALVAEQPVQRAAEGLTETAKKARQILELIQRRADFLVQIVVKFQAVTLNGLFNVNRHVGVALRELPRWDFHFIEKVVGMERICSKLTKIEGKVRGNCTKEKYSVEKMS